MNYDSNYRSDDFPFFDSFNYIPHEIIEIPKLEIMKFRFISSSLPPWIGELNYLKLLDLSYSIEIIDSAISQAIKLEIVDNFRFSKSFSRGKNQKNRWGKIKIAYELKNKGLNNKDITFGIESIEEKTYYHTTLYEKSLSSYLI